MGVGNLERENEAVVRETSGRPRVPQRRHVRGRRCDGCACAGGLLLFCAASRRLTVAFGRGLEVADEFVDVVVGARDADALTGTVSRQGAGVEEHFRPKHHGAALDAGVEEITELESEGVADALRDADLVVAREADDGRCSNSHSTTIVPRLNPGRQMSGQCTCVCVVSSSPDISCGKRSPLGQDRVC